jgi:PKD domain
MSTTSSTAHVDRRAHGGRRSAALVIAAAAIAVLLLNAGRAFASGPVAAIESNASVPAGQQITFDATSSTDDGGHQIVDYKWDLDGSGKFATDTQSSPTVTATYAAPGTVKVSVCVTDDAHRTSAATEELTVTGSATGAAPPSTGGDGCTGSGGAGSTGAGGAGTNTDGNAGIGPTIGGDAAAGIAVLTGADLKSISVGSDNHFAAITGVALRRARDVASHGLWINVLADRSATFTLTVSIPAAQARRLRLAGRGARGLVKIAMAATRLSTAGQRPFDVKLKPGVEARFRKLRTRVQLVVSGAAVDASGNSAAVTRAFAIRP